MWERERVGQSTDVNAGVRFFTEFILHGRADDERVARIHNFLLLCFCRVGICRLVYGTLPDMRSPGTVCRALL